ncbi:MAG: SIR2 family protein [Proteobacteria bacterium]|nr:SIR2 family protein [Pseudomonadota bacterium]
MTTHDPRQVAEDVRNHLATHDRRLSFLFGAGTSSAVNIAPAPHSGEKLTHQPLIPGIDGLTELCREAVTSLGEEQSKAWDTLVSQCEKDGRPANVEDLLSKARMKIDAIGEGETLVGLGREKLIGLESTICATIAKIVNPAEEETPEHTPHGVFASWMKKVHRTVPIEIFTTNYDLLFEIAFEIARVPVFDGFVGTSHPFFYPECLDDESLLPTSNWLRLWKLHGSVNWALKNMAGRKRIVRGVPSKSGEMILPSHRKYDESRKQPYVGYIDRLSRILNMEHALLITCGYSFGDEHLNAILYGALDNRGTANIIALSFLELGENDDLVKEAVRRSNLTVIAPNGGVISGLWGLWQLSQPVDRKTHSFMDTAFDSNGLPEDKGSPAAVSADLMGKMRLGDFNWFCRFLNSMGVDAQ